MWVQLHGLPVDYLMETIGFKIAKELGDPIFIPPRENNKMKYPLDFRPKHLPRHLNHTNFVIIPKKAQNEYPLDFWPIALCNVLYKVRTKILMNKIKPILHRLISPTQNAFVASRQITNNVLIACELFHSIGKMGRGLFSQAGHVQGIC